MRLPSEVNLALGSKLAWVMLTKRDSLWVRVLRGKYLRGHSFWEAEAAATDSWLWESIVQHREASVRGLCYNLQSGEW